MVKIKSKNSHDSLNIIDYHRFSSTFNPTTPKLRKTSAFPRRLVVFSSSRGAIPGSRPTTPFVESNGIVNREWCSFLEEGPRGFRLHVRNIEGVSALHVDQPFRQIPSGSKDTITTRPNSQFWGSIRNSKGHHRPSYSPLRSDTRPSRVEIKGRVSID